MRALLNWYDELSPRARYALAASVLCAGIAINALALDAPTSNEQLPEWIWASLVTGIAQGAFIYGAIKTRIDWLFSNYKSLAEEVKDNEEKLSARIDRALEREHSGRSTDR